MKNPIQYRGATTLYELSKYMESTNQPIFADLLNSGAKDLQAKDARIAELEAALELSNRYLEHPEVLDVTRNFALSGDAVVERNRKVLKG